MHRPVADRSRGLGKGRRGGAGRGVGEQKDDGEEGGKVERKCSEKPRYPRRGELPPRCTRKARKRRSAPWVPAPLPTHGGGRTQGWHQEGSTPPPSPRLHGEFRTSDGEEGAGGGTRKVREGGLGDDTAAQRRTKIKDSKLWAHEHGKEINDLRRTHPFRPIRQHCTLEALRNPHQLCCKRIVHRPTTKQLKRSSHRLNLNDSNAELACWWHVPQAYRALDAEDLVDIRSRLAARVS